MRFQPTHDPGEQNNLVDMVAQAVIDRIEQHEQVNELANMVVTRVIEMQRAEAAEKSQTEEEVASSEAQISPT